MSVKKMKIQGYMNKLLFTMKPPKEEREKVEILIIMEFHVVKKTQAA